jgi:hypothetical protein
MVARVADRAPWRLAPMAGALGVTLMLTAGCEGLGGSLEGDQQAAVPAAAGRTADPVVAFAAASSRGAETTIVLPETGQAARLRVVESYAAASGRECRVVAIVGGGGPDRTRTICGDPVYGWSDVRPLLRGGGGGGGIARP